MVLGFYKYIILICLIKFIYICVVEINEHIIRELRFSPSPSEGEKPSLIPKGEFPAVDNFCREILQLPNNTSVYHCATSKILPPLEFIGGAEIRPTGDTCRMFCKIHFVGRIPDYYFWEGIVPKENWKLRECIYEINGHYGSMESYKLITGRTYTRVVLVEKTKKGSLNQETFEYDEENEFLF